MKSYAVILAGGCGSRMDAGINKVFLPLRGVPAVIRAIAPFSALCAGAVLVAREEELPRAEALIARYGLSRFVKAIVAGGADRQASVANGLRALPDDAEAVLIHDGARALVTEEVVKRVLLSVEAYGTGIAAVPETDTIKRATPEGEVLETLSRGELYAMQTPQGFAVELIRRAHEQAEREGYAATDDAALLEHAGIPVRLTRGDPENVKLTTPVDVALAEAILAGRIDREAEE